MIPLLASHAAGWTVGDVAVHGESGLVGIVSGANGENLIEARGATQDTAWRKAVLPAEAVGMAGQLRGDEKPNLALWLCFASDLLLANLSARREAMYKCSWRWYCIDAAAAYIPSNLVLLANFGAREPPNWLQVLAAPFLLAAYWLQAGIVMILVLFIAFQILLIGLSVVCVKRDQRRWRIGIPIVLALVCALQAQVLIASVLGDRFGGMH